MKDLSYDLIVENSGFVDFHFLCEFDSKVGLFTYKLVLTNAPGS